VARFGFVPGAFQLLDLDFVFVVADLSCANRAAARRDTLKNAMVRVFMFVP
jgi:hypothetical protein